MFDINSGKVAISGAQLELVHYDVMKAGYHALRCLINPTDVEANFISKVRES